MKHYEVAEEGGKGEGGRGGSEGILPLTPSFTLFTYLSNKPVRPLLFSFHYPQLMR